MNKQTTIIALRIVIILVLSWALVDTIGKDTSRYISLFDLLRQRVVDFSIGKESRRLICAGAFLGSIVFVGVRIRNTKIISLVVDFIVLIMTLLLFLRSIDGNALGL